MEFTKESIEFFKREAQNYNTSYQAMICNLVDVYAKQPTKVKMKKDTTLSEELSKLPRERQELIEVRVAQIHLKEITLRHFNRLVSTERL